MIMEINTDWKIRCVKLAGKLDAISSNDLDQALMALIGSGQDIIIDLSECPYVSSAGIRILLKTNKKLQSGQHKLFLSGVAPIVFRVFEIAGLDHVFQFEATVEGAVAAIQAGSLKKTETREISSGHHQLIWQPIGEDTITGQLCRALEIVSYHELGFALGIGSLTGDPSAGTGSADLIASLEHCAGFLPLTPSADADFRITSDPPKTGLCIYEALSFGLVPTGSLKLKAPGIVPFSQLQEALSSFREDTGSKQGGILLVVANQDKNKPSLSIALANDADLADLVRDNDMKHFQQVLTENGAVKDYIGITFVLAELNLAAQEDSLSDVIRRKLTFENITAVKPLTPGTFLENPVVWIFRAGQFIDGGTKRLAIGTKPGVVFEPHKAFLARLLYADSSEILIDAIYGGYVAETFHVTSFDHEGRKMRPTVVKVAHRDLIARESERCKQYALPYIFNNSAVILGTEYYEGTGALRYNFVGIGGESSQLKWLTNYYLESDITFLEPLFDKIFLQILKPWYGQPVSKTIFPFRDHDPTLTFFPHIYQTVSELFSISADEKEMHIKEREHPVLNPYWFLKHEYARRRETGIDYLTSICHGDLNMQNILLDENMNVYLIDFSETKPRSVISDFARLEAIFMIDNAPLDDETDMAAYLDFIDAFYKTERLDEIPEITYKGKQGAIVNKNAALVLKMRKYAFDSSKSNPEILPYFMALLEWVLPVVCYKLPVVHKRLSAIISSILCDKVMKAG